MGIGKLSSAAGLALLFFVSGIAVLSLTDPLWFPAMRFGGAGLAVLGLVALQGAISAAVLWRWNGIGGALEAIRQIGVLRLVLLFALIAGFAVGVQGYWGRFPAFGAHLVVEGGIAIVALLNLVALVLAVPADIRGVAPLQKPWFPEMFYQANVRSVRKKGE